MTDVQGSPEVLIRVNDLSKSYGDIRAVDGISFEVRKGDVLAFLGPNGAGKTTAMKMITGFLEPDAGSVELCGQDVQQHPISTRRNLGYLPENAPAYADMTPRGFLEFIAEARGLSSVNESIERVVEMTNLTKVMEQPIETLSKGFKRRVGLAQALIHDPAVLILDEPTDGLDPNQKAMVQDLLSSLSKDRCIVLSTHILDEAERIANRALIISGGQILVDSTPSELMARAGQHNTVRVVFFDPVPSDVVEAVNSEDWCEQASADGTTLMVMPTGGENVVHQLLKTLGEFSVPIADVRLTEGRLDDLFREITKGVGSVSALDITGWRAVFRREFRSYFASPLGYIFVVIFLIASGYLMVSRDFGRFLELRQASLDPLFDYFPWLFVVLVPAVAMRLWAEERKSGTVELLLTLPVTLPGTYLGKFLAGWCFLGVSILLTWARCVSGHAAWRPRLGSHSLWLLRELIGGRCFLEYRHAVLCGE